MSNKLDYYNGIGGEVPEGAIRISASSIARYFTDTRQFWGELMLDEGGFTGSTASVLGTCVHYFGEDYVRTRAVDGEEIEDYIESQSGLEDVDTTIIREQYPIMGSALINEYVIPNPPTFVEEFLVHTVLEATANESAVVVGGSCDNMTVPGVAYDSNVTSEGFEANTAGIIVDYKTTSTRPTSLPKKIPFAYRLQALVYAYLYGKRGITIDRIRIVYVTRNDINRVGKYNEKTRKYGTVKQYPTEVVTLTESITDGDLAYIEGVISIIAKSVRLWETNPEFRSVISQDSRVI